MSRRVIISLYTIIMATLTAASAVVKIHGNVSDKEGNPLSGIIIRLYKPNSSSPTAFTHSDIRGAFSLNADSLPSKLSFSSSKYEQHEILVENTDTPIRIKLTKKAYELQEVIVKAPHTRVKGDTISYDVSAFTGKGDRNIEDVIKKLPGITVDAGGRIFYGEKPINNFYIEGLNLMGNNYSVASRNITPEDISTIDVYERHQSKRVLQGVREDDRAALNLRLKKGRMLKPIGHVTGGFGYGEHALWLGQLYGMFISQKNQTIISANGNNSGKPYFSISNERDGSPAYSLFKQTPFGTPSITESRFLNNKSAYFTANTLFKLHDETTISVNSSYALEHSRYDNYTRTEYFGTDKEDPVFEQSALSRLSQHRVLVSTKVEKNKEHVFLSNQAWFSGKFNANCYDLSQSINTGQALRSHNFNAGNQLKAILRKRNNVYEVSSFTSIDNTPVNTMSSTGSENDPSIFQTIKGISIVNSESTSFSWLINRKSHIGVSLYFSADYDRMHTFGEIGNSELSENYISGYKLQSVATPFYKFSIPGKFSITVQLPVNLYNINYTDLSTGKKYIHNRPYLDFTTSLMYKPSPFFLSNISFGRAYTIGDMTNFLTNPIYTTYRSNTTFGNGALNVARRDYIKGDFNYRNLLEGIYILGMASYSRTRHNTLSVYDVAGNGHETSSSTLLSYNHTEITHASVTATKDVREWKTLFSINGSGMWNTRNSVRSGREIKTLSSFYTAGARIETALFSDIVSININALFSNTIQNFKGAMPNVSLNDFSFNGRISIFPISILEIYGKVDLRHSQLTDNRYKTNLFIDAGARVKLRKLEIELSGNNLSNIRKYEYSIYNSLDMITCSYTLRPIQATLSIRYSF